MIPIFFATYGAVFLAEILGDKLLYTTSVLAARYRTAPILCGMALAFMGKMAVAVAVGKAISALPPFLIAAVTGASFIGVAIVLWLKAARPEESMQEHPNSKVMLITFAAIFFSEWGDVGQITAASMAARFGSPLAVWMGAVGAMVTKGMLAASIGAGARSWIQLHMSPNLIRNCGVALMLALGLLSVMEAIARQ